LLMSCVRTETTPTCQKSAGIYQAYARQTFIN
jgi:hypothetical protein